MALLIGTDEAGYGPNLGPLVISASAWQVPDEFADASLYETLKESVTDCLLHDDDSKLWIADSKTLYKPRKGLASLEHAALTALRLLGHVPTTWGSVFDCLVPTARPQLDSVPWYGDYEIRVPVDADGAQIEATAARLVMEWEACGVKLIALRSAAVFPSRFNALVEEYNTKGAALSHATLQLVADLVDDHATGQTVISCDKHGGRNRYYALLQHFFPDEAIQVVGESRAASTYRWGDAARRTECRFITQGEQFLPSALASIASKYLRELAMRAFNDYWQKQVPGIAPTAGYPVDAKRFKREIAEKQSALGISEASLWRCR